MSLRYGILGLLKFGPKTGYDINSYFQHSLAFFWRAQTSQIYRELNKLEKEELVTSEVVVQYDKPNRKVYRISRQGNDYFEAWLNEADDAENIRDSFMLKMFFSGFRDKKRSIEALKQFVEDMTRELESVNGIREEIQTTVPKNSVHRKYWEATSLYGINNYQMRIDWANNLISELSKR